MCLTLPAQIKSLKDNTARVKVGGDERNVRCVMSDIRVGDWVLVNADLAVEKITEKEAQEIEELIKF